MQDLAERVRGAVPIRVGSPARFRDDLVADAELVEVRGVSFSAAAAFSRCSAERQRIAAHPSGEMTE